MTSDIIRYFESIEQRISALEKAAGIAAEKATDKPAAPAPAEKPSKAAEGATQPAEEQKAERGDALTEADRSKLRTRLAALLHSQNTGAADRARAKIRGGELKRASDVETWEEFDAFESFLDEEGF